MKKFARIEGGIIVAMVDRLPAEIFHPDLAKLYAPVRDDAEIGEPVDAKPATPAAAPVKKPARRSTKR